MGGGLLGTTVLLGARPQGRGFAVGRAGEQRPEAPTLSGGVFHCSRPWETCLFTLGDSLQVASILEADFNQMEETTFSLPPAMLSSLQSGDVALTRSLVEGCELEAQGPAANSPGTWCHSCLRSTCPSQGCSCWPPRPCGPPG